MSIQPSTPASAPRSLFERLGGREGITRIVDSIAEAHLVNPVIRARFLPVAADPEHLARIKGHLCTFLETGSGGSACYTGRSMPDVHRGMNVSAAEYMAAVDDIMGALAKNGVDDGTRSEVLWISWAIKGEIIGL